MLLEQPRGREQEARRAERALEGGRLDESLLDRRQLARRRRQALERPDLASLRGAGKDEAAAHGLAVQKHRARAAHTHAAALAHAMHAQLVSEHVHERVVRTGAHPLDAAVHLQLEGERLDDELAHVATSTDGSTTGGPACAWRARSTFSAVMGRSTIRTPVARKTAFPIAGITAGRDVSPMPWISQPGSPSTTVTPRSGGMSRKLAI